MLGVGDVVEALESAGQRGDEELRQRLLHVLWRVADMIAPEPRWREPGDPTPEPGRRADVAATLFELAMARLGGDWGDRARSEAAQLVERLAEQDPVAMLPNLPALLGSVLALVDASQEPPPSGLEVPSG
ncbi:MAG: hypothetical protein GEU94_21745, partial [Micromonosporaceae bacterium]|nr:hypothetical protein [Micromonosporaceae bacterium]